MKSTDKQSDSPKTMLVAAKHSQTISKINAASNSSARVIPTIRTILIPSPQIFKTDPANFLALVQKHTGKKPAAKKLTATVGSKKKKSIVRAESAANHSQALAAVDEESLAKHLSEKQSLAKHASEKESLAKHVSEKESAAIKRDSLYLEEGRQLLDGLEELDFSSTLINSWSTLPEIPMSYHPLAFLRPYSGGFSHF